MHKFVKFSTIVKGIITCKEQFSFLQGVSLSVFFSNTAINSSKQCFPKYVLMEILYLSSLIESHKIEFRLPFHNSHINNINLYPANVEKMASS
jgi:hypothetical protein